MNYPQRAPSFFVHGTEVVAVAAGGVLASVGPTANILGSRTCVGIWIGADDDEPAYEVARRDATNSFDVEGCAYIGATQAPDGPFIFYFSNLNAGETVVVRAKTAGTSGKKYQADIYLWSM